MELSRDKSLALMGGINGFIISVTGRVRGAPLRAVFRNYAPFWLSQVKNTMPKKCFETFTYFVINSVKKMLKVIFSL